MLRLKQKALPIAIAVTVTAAAFSSAQAEKTVTLTMANWVPPVHHLTQTFHGWIAAVKKESGGTLIIKLDKGAVAKPPGMYDVAKNGIRDIAWGVAGYTPGRFPLYRTLELPFLSPNAEIGSVAMWDWYTRNGLDKKEITDTKLITVFVHGPGVVHSKKPIHTLADMKGVKFRVGGGGVQIAKLLGGVPVPMSATKAHESLRRGTTDGTLFPYEAIKGFRLAKLVHYHLEIPGGIYATPFFMVMNLNSWNKLSAKHKAVMMKVGGAWGARYIGKHWDAADDEGKRVAKAAGNKFSTISPAELKVWKAKLQPMYAEWKKTVSAKGNDADALLKDLRETIAKYSKK
ncbi:MAG: TRAP transporter substrate-binding protein [Alphaproteobacteria bacterium]|jgi:TRAP-type C4-dicarboxylate transport system substrate-binding protein